MSGRRFYIAVFLYLLVSACQKEYSTIQNSNIQYKILSFDDDNPRQPQRGDFIYLSLYTRKSNQPINLINKKIWVFGQKKNQWINPLLKKCRQGDSIAFMLPSSEVPDSLKKNLPSDTLLTYYIKIHKIQSPFEFQKELEYQQWLKDRELSEQVDLLNYLKANNIDYRFFIDGIYLVPLKPGNGKKPEKGATVYMHYQGYFIDGTEFDSTYKDGTPFEYRIGDPDQVIRGFEIAIPHLSEHAKAKIIIPSHLAFGPQGSSTGVVPPYTTVIYEVTILKIEK